MIKLTQKIAFIMQSKIYDNENKVDPKTQYQVNNTHRDM